MEDHGELDTQIAIGKTIKAFSGTRYEMDILFTDGSSFNITPGYDYGDPTLYFRFDYKKGLVKKIPDEAA
jgi:hypothetical protein